MTIEYTCPDCGHEFDVGVTPGCAGRLHGPPEMCYPSEDATIDPAKCPECREKVDAFAVCKEANEKAAKYAEPDEDKE